MPLWKQLLGACAGATVAVMVYQTFLFVSPKVQAWITIPTAPGVTQQDKAVISGDKDDERLARQEQRNRQILEKFGQAMSSAPVAMHAAAAQSSVASSASSRAISGGLKGVVDATKSILNGSSSSARAASSAPVAAAARSSSSRRSVAPVVTKGSDSAAPSMPRSERLPNSGIGLWIAASAAFGATTMRRRMMHKAANA